MKRRDFLALATTTAAALAAEGFLPVLAAEGTSKRPARNGQGHRKPGPLSNGTNIFTEPCAIEPVTGYLPAFAPIASGAMQDGFTASYSLIAWKKAAAISTNRVRGSLRIRLAEGQYETRETRTSKKANTVRTTMHCARDLNTVKSWRLESSIAGEEELRFVEEGVWDGTIMTVKAKSWSQQRTTTHPLIARWALLPLLASGRLKNRPLRFDMLDDSTLRPDQTLRYSGEIEIPVKGGKAKLDSYAQAGQGIVPTHYLVDRDGRVQLITMSHVNWALSALNN